MKLRDYVKYMEGGERIGSRRARSGLDEGTLLERIERGVMAEVSGDGAIARKRVPSWVKMTKVDYDASAARRDASEKGKEDEKKEKGDGGGGENGDKSESAKMMIPPNRVKFCVNVDMDGPSWRQERTKLMSYLPKWLACCGGEDVLRFMRQPIKGMSTPQLYLKVPGVWTGGHEENVRFRSVNINHGPGASVWGSVSAEHIELLHQKVQEHFGVDIFSREGHFFPIPDSAARTASLSCTASSALARSSSSKDAPSTGCAAQAGPRTRAGTLACWSSASCRRALSGTISTRA